MNLWIFLVIWTTFAIFGGMLVGAVIRNGHGPSDVPPPDVYDQDDDAERDADFEQLHWPPDRGGW